MRDPRIQKLADVLVNYSVGVKKDNLVRITGGLPAEPLMLELFRKCVEAGANPFLRFNNESADEIFLKLARDEQIKFINPIAKMEQETIDCYFGIWAEGNTRYLTGVDSKKLGMQQAARKPLMDIFFKRAATGELKWCGTQFPTVGAAQEAEMSLSDYEDFVYNAGLLHHPDPVASWKKVSERQQRLVDFLMGKRDYHVVAANGTDVRMSVAGKTWINCCGHENFPDGEVFTGPVIDSVDGVVHFSFPAVHKGRECDGVRLTFKNGRVVDASAEKGQDFLYSMLDMDAGSRFLGECAIGTNFGITRYTRNTLFDEKIGGTVHFALGAGYPETGNTNESGLHWDMVVDLRKGGFVEIDGTKVNVDGKFSREDWPML